MDCHGGTHEIRAGGVGVGSAAVRVCGIAQLHFHGADSGREDIVYIATIAQLCAWNVIRCCCR